MEKPTVEEDAIQAEIPSGISSIWPAFMLQGMRVTEEEEE